MGKKRKAPARAAAAQQAPREAEPNPFERLANRRRFDILGRKLKGETRNVVRLRSDATEKVRLALKYEWCEWGHGGCCRSNPRVLLPVLQHMLRCGQQQPLAPDEPRPSPLCHSTLQRKSTLLVEYKQLRKSNAFIDRRFGGELSRLLQRCPAPASCAAPGGSGPPCCGAPARSGAAAAHPHPSPGCLPCLLARQAS